MQNALFPLKQLLVCVLDHADSHIDERHCHQRIRARLVWTVLLSLFLFDQFYFITVSVSVFEELVEVVDFIAERALRRKNLKPKMYS